MNLSRRALLALAATSASGCGGKDMQIGIGLWIGGGGGAPSIPTSIIFGGDSLSEGFNSTNTLGLRGDLSWYLSLLAANTDFIGPFSTGGANLPDPDHCAQSGAATSTILSNFQTYLNVTNPSAAPRWIVTDGGINNVANNGEDAATASASVDTMLRGMLTLARTRNPAAQLIWQNAFNLPPGDPQELLIGPFNSAMVTKVAAINATYGANAVRIFDANTALGAYDTTNMGGNRLHPAEVGWVIVRASFMSQYRTLFRATANGLNALSVTVTSPTAGATLTVGVPVTITGTVSRPQQDVTVIPTKGGVDIAAATVTQYAGSFAGPATWSYSYTPVAGDVGALTIGARVTDNVDSSTATAAGVAVTVQAAAPADVQSIITSRPFLFALRADQGIVESGGAGTGVTTWTDQSPAGKNATQAGASTLRPTVQATNAAFNNQQTLRFLRSNSQCLNLSTLNLPAPGTTPLLFFMVFRRISWNTGQAIFGCNSSNAYVRDIVATPQLFAQWGTLSASNSGSGVFNSAASLIELFLNNAVSDRFNVGATHLTGSVNLGNNDPAIGLGIGAYANGTGPSDIEVAEFFAVSGGDITGTEMSNLRAYFTTRYGVGLLL